MLREDGGKQGCKKEREEWTGRWMRKKGREEGKKEVRKKGKERREGGSVKRGGDHQSGNSGCRTLSLALLGFEAAMYMMEKGE